MSLAKQMRRERGSNNKDTRWDRIRKRYANETCASLKSDAVRRLIEMDFVGKHSERMLKDENGTGRRLDPLVVMNLRHEMFQKHSKKLPIATVAHQKSTRSCISHNKRVEETYVSNELTKLRQQLERFHIRNHVKVKLEPDNETLLKSLDTATNHYEDFYAAPVEALREMQDMCATNLTFGDEINEGTEDNKENENDESLQTRMDQCQLRCVYFEECLEFHKKADGSLTNGEHVASSTEKKNAAEFGELKHQKCLSSAAEKKNEEENTDKHVVLDFTEATDTEFSAELQPIASPHTQSVEALEHLETCNEHDQLESRCVRFVDAVEVRKYRRENSSGSNTSDDIDSVISDLADEALFELQMEEEAKLLEQSQTRLPAEPTVEQETPQVEEGDQADDDCAFVVRRMQLIEISSKPTQDDISESTPEEQESVSNHEQNLIIEKLFQSHARTNLTTLRKYFRKWIHYTTFAKIERENVSSREDRIHKINMFLDKIRKEKNRSTKNRRVKKSGEDDKVDQKGNMDHKEKFGAVQLNKKYQNKIKMQQDIIDLQRAKLERQERLIMELKLKKLSEEAKEARQEIKNELKEMIRCGDLKTRATAKSLQLVGNLRDAEDEELARLQGKALLMPKFLQKMQERALERSVRHEQARQRRLQQEAEKEAQKMAAEEAKRLEDEEAKRLRIEALKEKRRQEKMAKIIKEREHQRAVENNRKAQEFRRRLLLRRVGMEGFKRLLQRKRDNHKKCEAFRRQRLKRTYFIAWYKCYLATWERKRLLADDLYDRILKRNSFACWQLYVDDEHSKYYSAVDWHELKLAEAIFSRWLSYTKRMKMIEATKMRKAAAHHEWHLKWKVLDCWQRLPQILKLEQETEERRQRWRMKIWELLPDYVPNRDDFSIN